MAALFAASDRHREGMSWTWCLPGGSLHCWKDKSVELDRDSTELSAFRRRINWNQEIMIVKEVEKKLVWKEVSRDVGKRRESEGNWNGRRPDKRYYTRIEIEAKLRKSRRARSEWQKSGDLHTQRSKTRRRQQRSRTPISQTSFKKRKWNQCARHLPLQMHSHRVPCVTDFRRPLTGWYSRWLF